MEKETKKKYKDIPVKFFIRLTKDDKTRQERALLIAETEKGKQYVFQYYDGYNQYHDNLIVCDL